MFLPHQRSALQDITGDRRLAWTATGRPRTMSAGSDPGKFAMTDTDERGFLRGLQSYGDRDLSIYMRRASARSMGYTVDELARPVVGIAYTHSKFNPCHRHFPELLDAIKRGVAAAGGLALEFPTTSLHESTLAPNSMKF